MIVFDKHPLASAIMSGQLAVTLSGVALILIPMFWTIDDVSLMRKVMDLVGVGGPVPITIAASMLLGAAIGLAIGLPALGVAIGVTKYIAQRHIRANMQTERDPARLAVLRGLERERRRMWFYLPFRMFAAVDAATVLDVMPTGRPIAVIFDTKLPPAEGLALGEEFNLVGLRQNPRRSKLLMLTFAGVGFSVLAMIVMAFNLARLGMRGGGPGFGLGTVAMLFLPTLVPIGVFLVVYVLPKSMPLRWAIMTPRRLEDARPLRWLLRRRASTEPRGVKTFTPDQSLLVISTIMNRRTWGTFVHRDGTRAMFSLIADDKHNPLGEVLARWK